MARGRENRRLGSALIAVSHSRADPHVEHCRTGPGTKAESIHLSDAAVDVASLPLTIFHPDWQIRSPGVTNRQIGGSRLRSAFICQGPCGPGYLFMHQECVKNHFGGGKVEILISPVLALALNSPLPSTTTTHRTHLKE